MKRGVRRTVIFMIIVVAASGIIWLLLPRPVSVDCEIVAVGALEVLVQEEGRTRIKERYVVSSPLSGRLTRIEIQPGDVVVGGETVLASLAPTNPDLLDARSRAQAEASVNAADAALKRASLHVQQSKIKMDFNESEYGRAKRLENDRSISAGSVQKAGMDFKVSQQQYRSAQVDEEIARYELDLARAALLRTEADSESNLDHLEIGSPISGQVLQVFQESSTIVTAGERLIEVGEARDLEVEVDVLTTDAVQINSGSTVRLKNWGGDEDLMGVVRLVEPKAFTKISSLGVEEQRVNVIIDFLGKRKQRQQLGDGYRVEANIVLLEKRDVNKVSIGSLFRDGEDWAVFRVQSGIARLQHVILGARNSFEAEVIEGLESGDRVVTYPSDQVRDGVSVRERAGG